MAKPGATLGVMKSESRRPGPKTFYGSQLDYLGGPFPQWYCPEQVNMVLNDRRICVVVPAGGPIVGGGWRREADRVFIPHLMLQDRPKVGVLLSPAQDYLFMNFLFLMKHRIPTHIIWREAERSLLHFIHFSPRFLKEFADAKVSIQDGLLVVASNLPSYHLWRPSLDRYDIFLVDNQMGKNGLPSVGFDPKAFHAMIDWPHWGMQWITDCEEIRTYLELYLCASALHDSGRFITFFRQEP
ncbi:hypothetical protein C8J57DRAFT_1263094 [Mycena rebaudengoi]|nr:hypothetical protein C8J57DRAFT_1263094 [Mycena rebaudengoi]